MTDWSGRVVEQARNYMRPRLPAPCGKCGRTVTAQPDNAWVVGHIQSRVLRPDLMHDPSNWQHEHRACSDASGQAAVIEKAKHDALRAAGLTDAEIAQALGFPLQRTPQQPPPLPAHTHGGQGEAIAVREGLSWADLCRGAPSWLKRYLEVPEDAAPPLWVSGVHPEAVCSYGAESCTHMPWGGVPFVVPPTAVEWMESSVTERGRPLRFRWWQRLAIVLQLQHRADGSLCFRVVLESGPRRIGKSVRLTAMGLWRLRWGPVLFEDHQLVLHTGKDLAIVREILKKAWAWADARAHQGWSSKKGMTEPELAYRGRNRWIPRSKDSTTGYDACLALVDEAWDVPPPSIDDDLEPTMMERESPQLLLTSTAHRRATSLMRGRILDALTVDDGETLVLIWAAPPGADPGDPKVWRAASPHWSEDRARMMASKYEKALAGEEDPELDDPDPMQGFLAQYLNRWRLRDRVMPGTAVFEEVAYDALRVAVPDGPPAAAAIESWWSDGVAVALAWCDPAQRAVLRVVECEDLESAVLLVRGCGYRGVLDVGASMADDPALRKSRTKPQRGAAVASVQELARLAGSDALRHDGGELLRGQALAARTAPSVNGARLTSKERLDAVKAATWAATAARRRGNRPSGMVLPR